MEIKQQPECAYKYTISSNAVAIITDGSMLKVEHQNELIPKLEAYSAFFKFFYNIDAYPLILDSKLCLNEDDILMAIENLAPVYKVIVLKHFDHKRIHALLPKLAAMNLKITVIF